MGRRQLASCPRRWRRGDRSPAGGPHGPGGRATRRPAPVPYVLLAVLVAAAAACLPPGPGGGNGGPGPRYRGEITLDLTTDPAICDPMGGDRCLLPFPNNHFTVGDDDTPTGRRVNLAPTATPANAQGVHIDPTELNRNDGFSPGSAIVALLPGLDPVASGLAPITDMARSLDPDAPIVLLDARTGERHPYWAELDARAPDDAHRLLFVRPAENLAEGHRYIVAIRGVVDAAGAPIAPPDAFRAYRDRLNTRVPAVEARRGRMESLFRKLDRAGVRRADLTLAWDFTVASGTNLSERLLAMRDDAFTSLGEAAPAFTVTRLAPSTRANLATEVEGTYEVPNYLTGDGAPGAVLNNGDGPGSPARPARNGTFTARFICTIPASAYNPDGTANPTAMMLYGHGLLGSAREVFGASSRYAGVANVTTCATWWIGMSEDDIGPVVAALTDMSAFRTIPDRLQQSMLNVLFLGRLMKHPAGFSSDPAFRSADGSPVLDQQNLTFNGVSQGGILGGAVIAVAQDWERAFLGVPAINYSTLLDRSVDFDAFGTVFDPSYPDWVDRQQAILLAQMLWDRGEGNGYAHHITSHPYPRTPAKQVMLFEAFGDHQVANVATEVMARTLDVRLRVPALAEGRSPDVEPFWGIEPVGSLPDQGGSYLVVWDFGTPAPPLGNVPNREGDDPHGMGRNQPEVLQVAWTFLEQGTLIDTCGGGPCQTLPPS
ncbi:MAG TPA: hypothetical protein VFI47_27290 [Acidimicrobiales bacterium]|nr:hypothetical protein [Acidimicrobiales bacterium]